MAAQEPQPFTVLLHQWHSGDPSALAAKFLAEGSGHGAGQPPLSVKPYGATLYQRTRSQP
jgi:hypothetical protein